MRMFLASLLVSRKPTSVQFKPPWERSETSLAESDGDQEKPVQMLDVFSSPQPG
jgi:hypothetical protein